MPSPEKNMRRFPHQLSGGMRQRVMIAIAIICGPEILFADEPTTALDVTIQAQVIDLMNGLKAKLNTAIVLITHDMGVVANMADRIYIMYAGKIVEHGSSADIFKRSAHPYTKGLLGSVPRVDRKTDAELYSIRGIASGPDRASSRLRLRREVSARHEHLCQDRARIPASRRGRPFLGVLAQSSRPRQGSRGAARERKCGMGSGALLEIQDLKVYYRMESGILKAVDGLSLAMGKGTTTGLVGESGCGKTTLGKSILRLNRPDGGRILFKDRDIWSFDRKERKRFRKAVQMIFQDPYASLDPLCVVGDIIAEGMEIHGLYPGSERRNRVIDLLRLVGLDEGHANRFPHEFSGGQRQRIGIARALAVEPRVDSLRRTHLRPGRLHPGSDRQSYQTVAEEDEPLAPFHHPRPVHGQAHRRPDSCHVPRLPDGTGAERQSVRQELPPVHEGPPVGHTGSGSGRGAGAEADTAERRRAQSVRTRLRLQLQKEMCLRERDLPYTEARVARARGRAFLSRATMWTPYMHDPQSASTGSGSPGRSEYMNFDFDTAVDRSGIGNMIEERQTPAIRAAGLASYWGAEFGFRTAPAIVDALKRAADNGLFGYTVATPEYLERVIWWFGSQRGAKIRREWILPTHGVIFSLANIHPRVHGAGRGDHHAHARLPAIQSGCGAPRQDGPRESSDDREGPVSH